MEKLLDTGLAMISAYGLKVIAALLIFFIGRWVSRRMTLLIVRLLRKKKVDETLVGFLENVFYYTLVVLVIIAAASQLGINTASLLTVVGAAGLAVGLALKDSLSNIASGVMLVLFRPFRVGDFVEAGGVAGKVVQVQIFNTVLNTADNRRVIVPNSSITGGNITNVTANPTRRVDLVIGIGYGDDIPHAKAVVADVLAASEGVLKDPAPVIAVHELADSSVNLVVRPWVRAEDYWGVYWGLTEGIKLAFDREGISIPYPQNDVHMIPVPSDAV
ncbi:MAG: mechanosensitive ion channel [Desulfobacterales bacterium]|nr:mechanosensitive ion channel [Desulfobacterales bacterium]